MLLYGGLIQIRLYQLNHTHSGDWRSAATSELNALEPSEEQSSIGLNQGGEFNPIEPGGEPSSSGLNQGEELNPIEPRWERKF